MQAQSTPPEQRYSLLDALRGFAIFGIFGVNMVASSMSWAGSDSGSPMLLGKADDYFQYFLDAFIEGKFYSIFSLLFGIGFGLQLERQADKGIDGLPIFKRRLWGMLFIGFMHMMLLWLGDIVFLYAWLGFVLIAFLNRSDRFLLIASVICLAMPVLLYPLRMMNSYYSLATPFYGLLLEFGKLVGIDVFKMNPAEMMAEPGVYNYFKNNIIGFLFRQADLFDQVRPFKVFSVFLIGYWISRNGWHKNPEIFLAWFKKYFPVVFPLAILINMGMALVSWDFYYSGEALGLLKTVLYFMGVVPLSLCYVYLFTSAYTSGRYPGLHAFTYVGRMALSNYLFHSVLYAVIFRGLFLGMAGKVGPIVCMVPVLIVFPLQIAFSRWWLERYLYGPAEWLWRSMTYGRLQPMKR